MAKHRKALDTKLASSVRFLTVKITSLTSSIKQSEARIKGEISIVSGEVAHDKANQIRINRRVNKEMSMIIHTANVRHSQSKRARGKLRAILNANKAAAAQEVAALAKKTRFACAMLRGKMARQRRSAAKALTSATQRLHKKINAAAKSALKGAKSQFAAKLNTLANLVSSNNRKFE